MPTNSPRRTRVRDRRTGELLEIFEDDFRRDRHESLPPEAPTPPAPAKKKAAPASTPGKPNTRRSL